MFEQNRIFTLIRILLYSKNIIISTIKNTFITRCFQQEQILIITQSTYSRRNVY